MVMSAAYLFRQYTSQLNTALIPGACRLCCPASSSKRPLRHRRNVPAAQHRLGSPCDGLFYFVPCPQEANKLRSQAFCVRRRHCRCAMAASAASLHRSDLERRVRFSGVQGWLLCVRKGKRGETPHRTGPVQLQLGHATSSPSAKGIHHLLRPLPTDSLKRRRRLLDGLCAGVSPERPGQGRV